MNESTQWIFSDLLAIKSAWSIKSNILLLNHACLRDHTVDSAALLAPLEPGC